MRHFIYCFDLFGSSTFYVDLPYSIAIVSRKVYKRLIY